MTVNIKKDAFYAYKAWLSKEPFVHICGKRYINRIEDVTNVTIYSNLPEVELFVNGISIGKQKSNDHFFHFKVKNQEKLRDLYKQGINEAESRLEELRKYLEIS